MFLSTNQNGARAPFRFWSFMSRSHFDDIVAAMTLTNVTPPRYRDRFWEVRQMIELWNENMNEMFSPGWVCCLDESMSIWHNKWTCPGWVYCPRKPRPFGNEYHDICCAVCNIIFTFSGSHSCPLLPHHQYKNLHKFT